MAPIEEDNQQARDVGALDKRIDLELVETRTFGSRVVYVRHQRAEDAP